MPRFQNSLSPVSLSAGLTLIFIVSYIGLIAVVMTYAALTVEFAQSVRNDEAEVASLESKYLAEVARITSTDYAAAGYVKPVAHIFVPQAPVTALR